MTHKEPAAWTDQRTDHVIGNLLRAGLMLSVGVVGCGAILYLIHNGGQLAEYGVFHGEPEDLRGLSGIVRGAMSLRPRHIIQFGLILLIATPVARVAFSVFAFAAERDWIYVLVTLIVLAILVASIAGFI